MRAWVGTGDFQAVVGLARHALVTDDYPSLHLWAKLAPPTQDGAKILHFLGELQRHQKDLGAAEVSFRRALQLRRDIDPLKATNTALELLALVRSNHPADETIEVANIAWDQARRGGDPPMRAMSATALVEILVDLGELHAAELVVKGMTESDSPILHALAEGRLQGARGRTALAVALFERASTIPDDAVEREWRLVARIELVHALLRAGRVSEAAKELATAKAIVDSGDTVSTDSETRLAAVRAAVALAQGDADRALQAANEGLVKQSRDAARVMLLNVRGDALARRGDAIEAEHAWRDAADEIETWRASIPSIELRAGLVAHQRHALEFWLDSAAGRGDVDAVVDVAGRILGRALLDRLRAREANATNVDAAVTDVAKRLADRRHLSAVGSAQNLRDTPHALLAILDGATSVWAIRRNEERWSIFRVGERKTIAQLVDALRGDPDNVAAATALGTAMFPPSILARRVGVPSPASAAASSSTRPLTMLVSPAGTAYQPPTLTPARAGPTAVSAPAAPTSVAASLRTAPTTAIPAPHVLAIAVDRAYSDLALASLHVDGRYLVEHVSVVELLVPDLVFVDIPNKAWSTSVVLGDPRGDLPGAAHEIEAVADILGARSVAGAEANRAALVRGASARTLHVATHSSLEDGRAAFVLADGTLSTHDIVKLRIAPRLAVIASCRSHINDDPEQSLVAAFLAAGTSGVVGVKRAIDDADGERFVTAFYAHDGANDPVGALAEAQRAAIRAGRAPHTWAAFSFFGTGGWLSTKEKSR